MRTNCAFFDTGSFLLDSFYYHFVMSETTSCSFCLVFLCSGFLLVVL